MANFVPQTADVSARRSLEVAAAVNAALRGDTVNTGRLICAEGAASVTVNDRRCRPGRLALLIPLNAAAAGLAWWLSGMARDSMTFGFSPAPAADAHFGWALVGEGQEAGGERL